MSTEEPDYQRLGRDLIGLEREARQLGSRQTVNLRVLELETAKQIIEEIFYARPSGVEEMIQRRLEKKSCNEENWLMRGSVAGEVLHE